MNDNVEGMKKLLLVLGIGAMAATAAPLVDGELSASGQAAVASYNAMVVCLDDMAACLSRIQDKATAAAEAPTLHRLGLELKVILANTEPPHVVRQKAITTADEQALQVSDKNLRAAGLAVHHQILRLAKEQFYHSAPLIKTFQALEMLSTDTDSLIR